MPRTRALLVAAALAVTLATGAACSTAPPATSPAPTPTISPSRLTVITPTERAEYLKQVRIFDPTVQPGSDDALYELGLTTCGALDVGVPADQLAQQGVLAQATLRAVATTLCPEHFTEITVSAPHWPTAPPT